jgi:hypothetical protein
MEGRLVGGLVGWMQSIGPVCENFGLPKCGEKAKGERQMASIISSTSRFVVSRDFGEIKSIQLSRRVEMFFY